MQPAYVGVASRAAVAAGRSGASRASKPAIGPTQNDDFRAFNQVPPRERRWRQLASTGLMLSIASLGTAIIAAVCYIQGKNVLASLTLGVGWVGSLLSLLINLAVMLPVLSQLVESGAKLLHYYYYTSTTILLLYYFLPVISQLVESGARPLQGHRLSCLET